MGLYPEVLNEYVANMGIPRGPKSKAYCYDPVNGDDNWSGLHFEKPMKTLLAVEDKCVADQHDCVLAISGDSADTVTESIVWDKDFTHLIGITSNLPGVGQRCRVVGGATTDVNPVITFSGTGCAVRNMQFNNEGDANVDSGAVVITANRCEFTNVFFAGMSHATPAARAGAFSLKLTGAHENFFQDCAVGTDSVIRAAANAELINEAGSSKNTWRRVKFMSHSATAGKFLVHILTSTTPQGINSYEDCLFYNNWTNWGGELTHAFNVTGAGATFYVDIVNPRLVGVAGLAATSETRFYLHGPLSHTDCGITVNPS